MSEPYLFLDGASGIYIPQRFANEVDRSCVTGVSEADWKVLEAGPHGDEAYWDVWAVVLDSAVLTACPADGGGRYFLYQDGDLWLMPESFREDRFETI